MAFYRTCINCVLASQPCARRDEVRIAIKGMAITSVKFRCTERTPFFLPGRRVTVTWPVTYDGEDPIYEGWGATVIAESGTRFIIAVDDAASDNETPVRSFLKNEGLFAKVSLSKLRARDEAPREICKWCSRAPGVSEACAETGWGAEGPPGCLVAQSSVPQ